MAKRPPSKKPSRRQPATHRQPAARQQKSPRVRAAATAPQPAPITTVAFVSLGCPKNLVDSEKMLGLLAQDGLIPVSEEVLATAEDGETRVGLQAAKKPALKPSTTLRPGGTASNSTASKGAAAKRGRDPALKGSASKGTASLADVVVVNTCGFLEASKDESLGEIRRAAALKKQGRVKRLVVAGCLVQRHRARMLEWCPDIDALIGVFDRDHIVEAVRGSRPEQRDLTVALPVYSSIAANAAQALRRDHPAVKPSTTLRPGGTALSNVNITRKGTASPGHQKPALKGSASGGTAAGSVGYFESDAARLRLTPRHYAYLRISEGCNQNCAFCTIPSIRGKMRSKPVEAIVAELRELLNDGAFEINLIGQDTTSYGNDIGYAPGLVGMLTALDREVRRGKGQGWLRLMYAYPSCFTDEMIAALAELPSVVKYIDMPLQHISDPVLTRMRRHTSRRLIETLLEKLRRRAPGIALRTTFISGFPGETDEDHGELVNFVRDFQFEAMGVFPYSPEPGTPAGTMHKQGQAVAADVVAARVDELMRTQQEVVFARHEQWAREGAEFDVLIDAASDRRLQASATVATTMATTVTTAAGARPGGGRTPARGSLYVGRTPRQAPQIDGVTYVVAREKLAPGEVVHCRVTDCDGYDLIAQPVEDTQRLVALPVLGH